MAQVTSQANKTVLKLRSVHYHVKAEQGELQIIKDCDLEVQSCQSVAIVGRSGSGKSTLLALMAGLEQVSEGEVELLQQSLCQLNETERAQVRANSVGFIFQNFQLMPSMTALENVLMPLELFNYDNAKERAKQALEKVALGHRQNHLPAQLSGGEQQRVAIARAIVTEPELLFADEPTGNLDETTAAQIQDLLFELQSELNTSLVIVTHDMDYAHRCQRSYLLNHGKLEAVNLND
jgi:putative ABC transport system ATP-binding protein